MALTQSELNKIKSRVSSNSSSMATSYKDYQKQSAIDNDATEITSGSGKSSSHSTKPKSIWDNIGDAVGGVVNFGKQVVGDIGNTINDSVGNISRVIGGGSAVDDLKNIDNQRNAIAQKYNSSIIDLTKQSKLQNNGQISNEDQQTINQLINKRNQDLSDFDKSTSSQVNKDQTAYKTSQSVDPLKTAAASANLALDVAPFATGLASGIGKSAAETAGKDALESAAVATGSDVAKTAAKSAVEGAVKESLGKQIFGSAAEGAIYGGAGNALSAVGNHENGGQIMNSAAQGATLGGALGAGGVVLGKAIGKVSSAAKDAISNSLGKGASGTVDSGIETAVNDASKTVNKDNAIDNVVNSADNSAKASSSDIAKQISDINSGKIPQDLMNTTEDGRVVADSAAINSRLEDLTSQYKQSLADESGMTPKELEAKSITDSALSQKMSTQTPMTVAPRDTSTSFDDLNAINQDGAAHRLAIEAPRPVANADDIMSNDKLPDNIRNIASDIKSDSASADAVLNGAFTQDKADAEYAKLDQVSKAFDERMKSIPDRNPRKQVIIDNFNKEIDNAYNNVQDKLDADADKVSQMNTIKNGLAVKEKQLVDDVNGAIVKNPEHYATVNEKVNNIIKGDVQQEYQQSMHNEISGVPAGTPDNDNPAYFIAKTGKEGVEAAKNNDQVDDVFRRDQINQFNANGVPKSIASDINDANSLKLGAYSLASPSRILAKLGLNKEGREISGRLIDQDSKFNMDVEQRVKTLGDIASDMAKSKSNSSDIWDVAENLKSSDILDESGKKAAAAFRKYFDDYEPMVKSIAQSRVMRKLSSSIATGSPDITKEQVSIIADKYGAKTQKEITELAQKMRSGKILPDQDDVDAIGKWTYDHSTLNNYLPHLADDENKAFGPIRYRNNNGDINVGSLNHRLTPTQNAQYSKNLMKVASNYTSAIDRAYYFEPVYQDINDAKIAYQLQGGYGNVVGNYLEKYLGQLKGQKDSQIGDGFNNLVDDVLKAIGKTGKVGEDHYKSILSTQRQISSAAAMGLNVSSMLRQTTQVVQNTAEFGLKDTIGGAWSALTKMVTNPSGFVDELKHAGVLDAGMSKKVSSAILEPSIKGKSTKALDGVMSAIMSGVNLGDVLPRSVAYESAMRSAARDGLTGEEAIINASYRVLKSNFSTSRIDMPLALNSDGVRSLTQFLPWSSKAAEFFKDKGIGMIKDPETGAFHIQPKEVGKVISAIAVAGTVSDLYGQLFGFQPTEFIPFYSQIQSVATQGKSGSQQLYTPPLLSLLTGNGTKGTGLISIIQDGGDMGKWINNNYQSFIPAGTQIKRMIQSGQTSDGYYTNSKGDITFRAPRDEIGKAQALIFGKYASQNGQDWINSNFPTMSDSQTKTIQRNNTQQAKDMQYDFYAAAKNAPSRKDAYDAAQDAISNNQPNKAQRLINDYNNGLIKALRDGYGSKYNTMTDSMKEYLSKELIQYSKVESSTQRQEQ